ncbi:MAG: hypothetical protein K2W82_16175 [Candidatus Obscuribacterales bacterium]|nr:hypothetical protein [Candidatus Obscuribacterales bacterium]
MTTDSLYQQGIAALNQFDFNRAVNLLRAARAQEDSAQTPLIDRFIATAETGQSLPHGRLTRCFDYLLILGNRHLAADELDQAASLFELAQILTEIEPGEATLKNTFRICERMAQVAFLQGDLDGAQALVTTVTAESRSGDVPPGPLARARELQTKLDAARSAS